MHATVLTIAALVMSACRREVPAEHGGSETVVPQPRISCAEMPAGAVALIAGGTCGVAVVSDGKAMSWASLQASGSHQVIASGDLPDVCTGRPCEFEGHFSKGHRLVIGSLSAADGEVPETVWVGWALDSTLVFLEVWSGTHAEIDGTRAGPAWALEPRDCGGELGFLVAPRLQGAESEAAPPSLVNRQGLPRLGGAGEWTFEAARTECSGLGLELP